jgi:hypothetical protein
MEIDDNYKAGAIDFPKGTGHASGWNLELETNDEV